MSRSDEAKSAYTADRFVEASRLFDSAFRQIPTEEERNFADKINSLASAREIMAQFQHHLGLAREFSRRGLYQAACSEYREAWNGLPQVLEHDVVVERIESGMTACSLPASDYRTGANDLKEAFRNIPLF